MVLAGNQPSVSVAVLDATGQPQWQRSFAAPSLAVAANRGPSRLIEYPGHGFWLIVLGSQRLSTVPNPPAVNTALTLGIVCLSTAGELIWAKTIAGLQTSSALPEFQSIGMGADDSLFVSLTDEIVYAR